MVAFTPAADSEVHLARAVIAIWPSGERHGYRSVAHAARELQLSKSSVRSACRAGRHPTGIFFKYSECKADPEGAPRPLGEDCPGSAPAAEQAGPSDLQFADLLTSITEDGQETGEVVWDILAAPVRGREEEIRLYCSQLSQESLITTIRVDNGAMNCDQLCAAAGGSQPYTAPARTRLSLEGRLNLTLAPGWLPMHFLTVLHSQAPLSRTSSAPLPFGKSPGRSSRMAWTPRTPPTAASTCAPSRYQRFHDSQGCLKSTGSI